MQGNSWATRIQKSNSRCFRCNQTGHWAKDCTNPPAPHANSNSGGGPQQQQQHHRTGACYHCHQEGHWAADCPSKPSNRPRWRTEPVSSAGAEVRRTSAPNKRGMEAAPARPGNSSAARRVIRDTDDENSFFSYSGFVGSASFEEQTVN